MRSSSSINLSIAILAAWLLAGCASAVPAGAPAHTQTPGTAFALLPAAGRTQPANRSLVTLIPTATLQAEPLPTPQNLSLIAGSSEMLVEPTLKPTPPALHKEIKAGLAASDPSLVQLAAGDVQLVEFFAYWCAVCRSIAPIVHGLEADYGERMNFVYLDIDDPNNDPFKETLGYRVQPHLFLLDEHGKIIREWLGRVTEADLRQAFDAALD